MYRYPREIPRRRSAAVLSGAAASLVLALTVLSVGGLLPAVAACAPDSSGTIICTGTLTGAPGGVAVPLADGDSVVNNGTIGAVYDAGGPAPGYGIANLGGPTTSNTVVNIGTILVDTFSYGVVLGDQNRITNNGAITIGDLGTGISVGDGNVIDNHGTISAAPGAIGVYGISIGSGNTVTNYGVIDVGFAGVGVTTCSCTVDNTIVNYGTISTGDLGAGILAADGSRVTNNGTIRVGADGVGIDVVDGVDPAIGRVANTGTVNGGDGGIGIRAFQNYGIVNSGTITVGTDGAGIVADTGNTVVNNGDIFAGSGFSAGIAAYLANVVTNNGRIVAGPGGVGVYLVDTNTFANNGTIRAGASGISVGVDPCCETAFDNIVRNHGTLDGRIHLSGAFPGDGSGNSVENWGLITITDPGTPVGAPHVIDGTFTQYATGTLELRVDAAGASDALLAESAFLAGKLRAVIQPGLYGQVTTYFSVVSTCGCSGLNATTFETVSSSSPFFSAAATYVDSGSGTVDTVDLTLTRIPFGSVPGLSRNQQAVGNALETTYDPLLPPGPAATLFSNLLAATDVGALDALSGEGTIGAQHTAFLVGDLFTSLLSNQAFQFFQTSFGPAGAGDAGSGPGALPFAPTRQRDYVAFRGIRTRAEAEELGRWRGWVSGFGATRSLDGDAAAGTSDMAQRGYGGALGAGYLVTPDLLVGAAAGASRSKFSSSARATSGELDAGHVGGYAIARSGNAYAAGTVSYAHIDNDISRTIVGVGPTETARGLFSSDLFSARFEAGYRHGFARVALTPFVALAFSRLWQRGYAETSTTAAGVPGVLGLSFQPVAASSVPLFLGMMIDQRVGLGGGRVLTPYVKASWMHEFSPDRTLDASFLSLSGTSFIVTGAPAARDAARIETGARLSINQAASLFVAFEGEFSDRSHTFAGSGGLKVAW